MVLTLALAAPVTFAQRQQTGPGGFYLRNNDTVVFYGDSITEQRLYTLFAEAFVVTRYPELNVKFVHSGWGGASTGINLGLGYWTLVYPSGLG